MGVGGREMGRKGGGEGEEWGGEGRRSEGSWGYEGRGGSRSGGVGREWVWWERGLGWGLRGEVRGREGRDGRGGREGGLEASRVHEGRRGGGRGGKR